MRQADVMAGAARPVDRRYPQPAPARRSKLIRRSDAGEVVMAYLRAQVEAIAEHDPLVRRDEPDAVHQMRVAIRRLRSALRVFGRVIERDQTRAVDEDLKWLAGVLSQSRDLEVLHARVDERLAGVPVELMLGPVAARVAKHFARARAESHATVVDELGGARYSALRTALDALVADPPRTALAGEPARRALPPLVGLAYRRLDRSIAATALPRSTQPGDDRDAVIHQARKDAKRVRYAAEAVEPVLRSQVRDFTNGLKPLQRLLGEHQDSVVARPVLRELAAQAHLAGENAFTFGLLYERESAVAAEVERDLPAAWRRASRRRNRHWMR